jgi:hypothetical protein
MTPFAASVSKTCIFKLCDEFPYLGRHTIILILLRDARYSLCSQICCQYASRCVDAQGGGKWFVPVP